MLDQAIQHKKTTIEVYEKLKLIAEQLQKEHLWNQAHDHSETGNETTRKHAKCLLQEEIQWEAARHLRQMMGQSQNGAMDWIKVNKGGNVDEDGAPILTCYSDQLNVECIIMDTNSKCFQLTETTPPMQEPLVGLLGYLCNTEAAWQIHNALSSVLHSWTRKQDCLLKGFVLPAPRSWQIRFQIP
jgi:hypothetical protein